MRNLLLILFILFVGISCKKYKARNLYAEGLKLEQKDLYHEAIKLHDEAIVLYPNFADAILDRGIDKSIIGDCEGAIEDYNKFIELLPHTIEPYVQRAECKRRLSDNTGAIRDVEQALRNKKWDENGVNFEKLYDGDLVVNTNYDMRAYHMFFERGAANFNLGNYYKALKDLNTVIYAEAYLEEAHLMRGLSYIALGVRIDGCEDLRYSASLGSSEAKKYQNQECTKRKFREDKENGGTHVYNITEKDAVYLSQRCDSITDFEKRIHCSELSLFTKALEYFKTGSTNITSITNTKLIVEIIISEVGNVDIVKIIKSVGPEFDNSVVEFFENTKWEAAEHKGYAVKLRKKIPMRIEWQ